MFGYKVVYKNWKKGGRMEVVMEKGYTRETNRNQMKLRSLVMDGLEQIKEGKTKDFDVVCERLQKKYLNEV